jgi:DNA modification methylase
VLDARKGAWQKSKRDWRALGIQSELGRSDKLTYGREGTDDFSQRIRRVGGTSIFDPVLAELIYTRLCSNGAHVLDPFAGGSVRGIVAAKLGYRYTGVELRPEQVEANYRQVDQMIAGRRIDANLRPHWIEGDSREIQMLAPGEYDLVFTCPPYGDLERYSDDPRDLSNMIYETFLEIYTEIVTKCFGMLKPKHFACFVVGDFRDKRIDGNLRGFPEDTVKIFQKVGARLQARSVLFTALGSAALRAERQFLATGRPVTVHQNVFVFQRNR